MPDPILYAIACFVCGLFILGAIAWIEHREWRKRLTRRRESEHAALRYPQHQSEVLW